MPDVTVPEHTKSDVPNLSWKEIFSDSQISSNSSDIEGSDKSVPSMKRDLMREMFAQGGSSSQELAGQSEGEAPTESKASCYSLHSANQLAVARTGLPLHAENVVAPKTNTVKQTV